MTFRRITTWGFLALMAFSGVGAQESVADLTAATPSCALPCVLTAIVAGNCSLTSIPALAECICTNVPLQSNLSTCTQQSCVFSDQIKAGSLRTDLCAAFPKESKVDEVRLTAILAIALSTPVVILRCMARWKVSGRLWDDDWLEIIALVLLVGGAGVEIMSAEMGFGLHYWDVPVANAIPLLKMFYTLEILYTWIKVFAKVSILLLFRRVFPAPWFQWAVKIFLAYFGIAVTTWTFVLAFQCNPVARSWDRSITTGSCLDVNAIGYVGAVMSVAEDVALIVLPLPELRKLQVSGRKRFGVAFMLAIGSFLPPLRPWFGKLVPPLLTTRPKKRTYTGKYGMYYTGPQSTTRKTMNSMANDFGGKEFGGTNHNVTVTINDVNVTQDPYELPSPLTPVTPASVSRQKWEQWELGPRTPMRPLEQFRDGEPHALTHDMNPDTGNIREPANSMESSGSETDLIIQSHTGAVQVTHEIEISSEPRRFSVDEVATPHTVRVGTFSDVDEDDLGIMPPASGPLSPGRKSSASSFTLRSKFNQS